ncbi:MAG: glycosyltransferase family 2 protein [Bryobacterales bacterium]|nr:glycosyltransferase family 2 protein [Bryobacteraceae bacterium]MDW8353289.1 glycosyltransferase family 2 protein [Bryobacterales bacterium]
MIAAAVFLGAAAGLIYVVLLYPLLLALLARWFPKPVVRRWEPRTVTVIIAARNAERWIRRKLESVLASDYPRELLDVLVVSDGSTDRTEEIVRSFADRGVRLLVVPSGGKPAALNAAFPHARGELLLLTDVRQILEPDCLKRLVCVMADPTVGAVSGNLIIRPGASEEERSTGLYWRYETWIRRNLSRVDSLLGATGPIYLVRRDLVQPIPPDQLLDDVYLPLSIHLKGYRLVLEEDAVAYDEPTTVASEFRRKVRTQAGVLQLLWTFPGLFGRANRMRFHFVSLKLGRLALPYLLAALLISALAMPAPWRWMLAGPQLAAYGIALADFVVPRGWRLKRLTAPARAFGALVLAALFALSVLVVPPRSLWVEARPS